MDTITATADRIAEHAERHRLRQVELILHGGEPLLAGPTYIAALTERVNRRMPPELGVAWGIQTNGVMLDHSWLHTLANLTVKVCVSIDGNAIQHNRNRLDRRGSGSYSRVAESLRLLATPEFADLFAGLLAVVDLRNDPVEVYEELIKFKPPQVDFLLPHGNWSNPPPRWSAAGPAPYGDWLSAAFDRWYGAERQETVVRLFRDTVVLLLGGQGTTSHIGLSPIGYVVVSTDGQFEQADSIRTARPSEPQTGFNVFQHTVDDVLTHPAVRRRQHPTRVLAADCRRCSLVSICGGGNYVHRYRQGMGFQNRSVYCADLARYITHVESVVRTSLA